MIRNPPQGLAGEHLDNEQPGGALYNRDADPGEARSFHGVAHHLGERSMSGFRRCGQDRKHGPIGGRDAGGIEKVAQLTIGEDVHPTVRVSGDGEVVGHLIEAGRSGQGINVGGNPLFGSNYRVRSCALYIQLNRKRTPIKANGPEMDR